MDDGSLVPWLSAVIMMIIAIIFIIYMLSSLISNTHEFWFTDLN